MRGFLFDLDDTLMDHEGALAVAVDDWCVELGLPPGQGQRFREIEKKWFARYEAGETTHQGQRAGRCREFLDRPELSDAAALELYDGYLAAYERNWRAFPDALPALRAALSHGPVGILTNGTAQMQWAKLRAGGLDLERLVMIATVDIGKPKPQPEAYLAACEALGTAPAETLMIGDSLPNDVEGAQAAGLPAVWLQRGGGGDITSLAELF